MASDEVSPRSTAAVPCRAENAAGSTVTVTVAGVAPAAGDTLTPELAGWKAKPLPRPPGFVTVKVREIVLLSQKFPFNKTLGVEVVTIDMESRKPTGRTSTPESEMEYITFDCGLKMLFPLVFSGSLSFRMTVRLSAARSCRTGGSPSVTG